MMTFSFYCNYYFYFVSQCLQFFVLRDYRLTTEYSFLSLYLLFCGRCFYNIANIKNRSQTMVITCLNLVHAHVLRRVHSQVLKN